MAGELDPKQVRQAIADLLDATAEGLAGMADKPRDLLVAGGAVARSRQLLRGACALVDADSAEVAGLQIRSLFECLVFGLYVLYGGEDAWTTVSGNYTWQVARFNLPGLDVPNDVPPARPRFDQLVESVVALLDARNEPTDGQGVRDLYEILYRSESHFSVHGGLGAVLLYYGRTGPPQVLLSRPEPNEIALLAIGSETLRILAGRVFEAADLPTAAIEAAAVDYAGDRADEVTA